MYSLKVRKNLDKKLKKLKKKDRNKLEKINNKVKEILKNPHRFKNLRKPLQEWKRIQIGSYVLCFSVDNNSGIVTLEDYDHHDDIYKAS